MLYFHIPFCRTICHYCDFFHTASQKFRPPLMERMLEELTERASYLSSPPKTIYFGGGTPSCAPLEGIALLMERARSLFCLDGVVECTIECNPDDITASYAQGLRELGFNRVSLGVQSFNDEHLRLMNRRHTASGAREAVKTLREAGFENITIDLIFALPFMSESQWRENLREAIELEVEHISAYHLTIEKGTQFARSGLQAVDDAVSENDFSILREVLLEAGYEHYEVSNFAREGFRAVHNSGYWRGEHYLGIGPSAHSYNGSSRLWNPSSLKGYIAKDEAQSETLSCEDIYNERLMVRLRCAEGLFFEGNDQGLLQRASSFIAKGDLIIEHEKGGTRLRIPPSRFLVSDYIISSLFI